MARFIKILGLIAAWGLALAFYNSCSFSGEADPGSINDSPPARELINQGPPEKAEAPKEPEKANADKPGKEPLALPVPSGMEDRVKLWELVYGKYDSSQLIIYHQDHPGIIYKVVRDIPRKKKRALTRIRSRLYVLDRIEKNSADPVAEIRKKPEAAELLDLYQKFSSIPEKDKFEQAAQPETIGVLRGRKDELTLAFHKAGPYLSAMERIFEDHGLPAELTRMVFVESMFDREAESSKDAYGVWQLMPSAAKPYLVMTRAVDERRDPVASTRASAQILKKNYQSLGSWPLAVTAYNAGTTRMKKAVKRTGTDSLPELLAQYDHHAFGFAVENFYARVLGVVRAEKRMGLLIEDKKNGLTPLEYDLVPLPRSYALSTLSRNLGMAPEMLIAMNPAWTEKVEKDLIPVPRSYLLRIPKGSESVVREALNLPQTSATSSRP